jgi:pimeloyl-ACP methyl ester carboxylesterase
MNATWIDTTPFLGQAGRVDEARALASRPGLSFVASSGGRIRVRTSAGTGPRLVFATDLPNVIEHYDALFEALDGRADVVVFEPPGTGASTPHPGFDFTLNAFTRVCGEVLDAIGPRTLIFPCYLGFVGHALARRGSARGGLVTPQTPSWRELVRWNDRVDPRRLIRTPIVGQAVVAINRRGITRAWYRASTGSTGLRTSFIRAAEEAYSFGGCYCLASLMQGYRHGPAPDETALPVRTAVVWGTRDRTHPALTAIAEVVRFECGHSPELENPTGFVDWLLRWCAS